MKSFGRSAAVTAIAMILMGLSFTQPVWSQNANSLDIAEAVICREVADHKPIGSFKFSNSIAIKNKCRGIDLLSNH